MKFHTIIYIDDYADDTLAALMSERDTDKIAAHLAQWDYGEYHDTPTEDPWGTADEISDHTIPYAGTYVLAVNYGLGYAALHIAEVSS